MGKVICELHGARGGAMVSPAVARAVQANERWPAHALVRIRLDLGDDVAPLSRVWLDRATTGHRDDDRVVFDDDLDFTITCHGCLQAWLRTCGVDDSYPPDEQRFLRVAEALDRAMRPRLYALIAALGRTRATRFHPGPGRPFMAFACSSDGSTTEIEVRDHGDHLVASVGHSSGTSVPGPLRIDLVDGELAADGIARAAAWADAVATALARTDR